MGLEWPGPPGGASPAAPDKDSDNTRNRERNVGKRWGTYIAKGIALALLYGIAYLALRYVSFNQWFLPAGLRAACLLFLPYRYWPFVILGDASAVFFQRLPKLDQYATAWVYGGPVLLIGSVAIAPHLARLKLRHARDMHFWMPLTALFISVWAAMCTSIFNYALGGPRQPDSAEKAVEYVTGNYLGILMFVLPLLFWQTRKWRTYRIRNMGRDSLIACLAILALFLFVEAQPGDEGLSEQIALLLMIIPAAWLTFSHGWHGAAIGIFIVNVGTAQAMEYVGVPKHFETVFLSQIGLSIFALIFLLLGSRITSQYETARRSGIAEQDALKLARMSLLSNEPAVRDQLIMLASMQVLMDDERDQLAKDLRANGKAHAAMELHRRGVEHRQLFQLQALVVYPIGIERDGLFGLLDTEMFRESRASGAVVDMRFGRTDPRTLSEALQVSAYRCLCHAIDHLSDWEPTDYRLHLRVWHGRLKRGIYISAHITTAHARHVTPHGESAWLLLEARVKAHGGLLRHGPDGIRLLLAESMDEPSAEQETSFAA